MKYLGSKARFYKDISPILAVKKSDVYLEPFVGGCNFIDKVVCDNRFASDSNKYLVDMWIAVQNGWMPAPITKEEYSDIRANKDRYPSHIVGWAGFGLSYSGKWFGGYAGKVDTKDGIRDYQDEAIRNLIFQSPRISSVKFIHSDYLDLHIDEGTIVYCDPPYANTTGYAGEFDSARFWNWARILSKRCRVFISEYSAPSDFICVWEKESKSSLSANGVSGGNKLSVEKLFTIGKEVA